MIMSGDADVVTVYYRESPGRFLTVIGKLRPLPDGSGFLAVLIKRDKKTYAGGMACLKKELRDENGHLREGRERTFTKVSVSLIDRRKPLVPYLFTGVWDSISHHAS